MGNLVHAYIFEGPAGVGKHTAAKALAKALVCVDGGCGRCEDCIRVSHDTHPDVVCIAPEGTTLGIEQIRELQHNVSLTPMKGTYKLFVIDEADAMTTQAANAFLRTLEEPPGGVIFILVTSNVHALLPTIRSRCRQVSFSTIPSRDIVALLQERFGFDVDEAELATRVSGGVVGKALSLMRKGGMDRRSQALNLAQDLPVLDSLDLMNAAEGIAAGIRAQAPGTKTADKEEVRRLEELAVSRAHASFIRRQMELRGKRRAAQQEREAFEGILAAFDSWFRDVLVSVEGAGELIVNVDHADAVAACAAGSSEREALGCIGAVDRARAMIRSNVNPQLALETMLFDIQECSKCNV